jgi:hypothetical protein
MKPFLLTCHPSTPCAPIRRCEIRAHRESVAVLSLSFQVEGNIEALALPAEGPAERTDGLWRHTCFEAFLRGAGRSGYYEFNFSPSRRWAIYHFDAYRAGMAPAGPELPPQVELEQSGDTLRLTALIDLTELGDDLETLDIDLAVSAVIETRDGALAYWAYRHPAGQPDFHHPDAFGLGLARTAPSAAYAFGST